MIENVSETGSHLIYGCMGLGGSSDDSGYGAAEVEQAESAIAAALDIGITVFDTADIYKNTKSESVLGEVLAHNPDLRGAVHIQTKCGIFTPQPGSVGRYDLSPQHIIESVERALVRLRTDHIDTLLLHRADPLIEPDAVAVALDSLRTQGLVHEFGVSNMAPFQIEALNEALPFPLVANQLELSLFANGFVEGAIQAQGSGRPGSLYPAGTVEYSARHGLEVQAWSPLARGRYTGASIGTSAEDLAASALVRDLATTHETTPETIVLWWLTRHPAHIVPVIGSANPSRIRACEDANRLDSAFTREQWYELFTAARGHAVP